MRHRKVIETRKFCVYAATYRKDHFIKVTLTSSDGETAVRHLKNKEARRLAAALLLAETLKP